MSEWNLKNPEIKKDQLIQMEDRRRQELEKSMEDEDYRLEVPLSVLSSEISVDEIKKRYSLPIDEDSSEIVEKVSVDKTPWRSVVQ